MQIYSAGLVDFQSLSFKKFNIGVENVALKKRTDAFEAVMIKMLLDNGLKDVGSIFSKEDDFTDKIYNSMYREELAKSGAGGFGFSQILYDYLTKKG